MREDVLMVRVSSLRYRIKRKPTWLDLGRCWSIINVEGFCEAKCCSDTHIIVILKDTLTVMVAPLNLGLTECLVLRTCKPRLR